MLILLFQAKQHVDTETEVRTDFTHPDTTARYANVGDLYSILGETSECLAYRIKALRMDIDLYGPDPLTGTYNNVGNAHAHKSYVHVNLSETVPIISSIKHHIQLLKLQLKVEARESIVSTTTKS